MNVYFKILEVQDDDNDNHIMIIRWTTDILTEEVTKSSDEVDENGNYVRCKFDFSYDIPIPEPTVEELKDKIFSMAPVSLLKRFENIMSANVITSSANTSSIIGQSYSKTEDQISVIVKEQRIKNNPSLSEEEIAVLLSELSANT